MQKKNQANKPKVADNGSKGYTKASGSKSAIRNCKAVGGTWKNGRCVRGVLHDAQGKQIP